MIWVVWVLLCVCVYLVFVYFGVAFAMGLRLRVLCLCLQLCCFVILVYGCVVISNLVFGFDVIVFVFFYGWGVVDLVGCV